MCVKNLNGAPQYHHRGRIETPERCVWCVAFVFLELETFQKYEIAQFVGNERRKTPERARTHLGK